MSTAPAEGTTLRAGGGWRSWFAGGARRGVVLAVAMMVLGSLLATWVNSNSGSTMVSEVTIFAADGHQISAYVYAPKSVSAQHPAPGIAMWHGLNNQKDYMDNTALEMARRGFVVVSADQPGHGLSTGANQDIGCGGPDVLTYLQSLPTVDKKHIGLLGMSQGGFCSATAAALSQPDGYSSIFYMESEPNPPGVPDSTPYLKLHNVAFNIGSWTELGVMILVGQGSQASTSPELLQIFGSKDPIVPDKLYGSIADGTARILYQPWEDHALSTDSTGAIGNAISWMQQTLGGSSLPSSDQVWPLKVLGTAIALFGAFLFIFFMGAVLLSTRAFAGLVRPVPEYRGLSGIGWWIGALITTAVGPLLYLWVWQNMFFNPWVGVSTLWPQTFTNIYMVWAVLVGVIAWVLIVFDHLVVTRRQGGTLASYGIGEPDGGIDWPAVGRALLFVAAVLVPIYVLLTVIRALWHVDFRLWVVSMMPMSPERWGAFFAYLAPFAIYFVAQGIVFNGFLRWRKGNAPLWQEMLVNAVVLTLGALVWVLACYLPLLGGGGFAIANGPLDQTAAGLGGIYYLPLLVLWPLAACIYTYFYRKTGRVFVGALMVTVFIVWNLAAFGDFAVWPIIG